MEEVWKDVVGFEEMYLINNKGEIYSLKTKRIMKTHYENKSGYERTILRKNNKSYCISVHRAVAMAFIPNEREYKEVNHIDENKTNNNTNNLEWCDRSYNNTYGTKIKRAKEHTNYKSIANKNKIEIIQMDMYNNVVRVWASAADCKRETNLDNSIILKCCKGKAKQAYGYFWKYRKDVMTC